ncbi:hypothetical protein EU245_04865 [Lentibacillus lipolyticus]|nr:hypothetical protein EU245_04865 [Lentibacillus lipolyticus]
MSVHKSPANRMTSSAKISNAPQVLRPGQIIQGKIMKLYPGQKAQIKIGPQRMIAQLEASLTVGGKYHFQVQPSDNVIHLRVIGDKVQNQRSGNTSELLQQLGLKASKSNAALIQSLIKEKIPFTKEQLQQALHLLNGAKNSHQTIKNMISAGLPITESVYQSLASADSNSMTEQMQSLLNLLRQNPDRTNLQPNLIQRLSQLVEPTSGSVKPENTFLLASPKKQFLNQVQQVLQFTGLDYENMLASNRANEQHNTVKAMLLQFLQQSDGTVHERSQQLLHFLNGMQLQSVIESANVIHANLQLPGAKLGLPEDIRLEFSGNKTENGEINPDSCRILFYLELTNLKETIIDMHIQKRSVGVTIYNNRQHLTEQTADLKPLLKEGLAALNYQLSTVTFKPIYNKQQTLNKTVKAAYQQTYQGVDYRI